MKKYCVVGFKIEHLDGEFKDVSYHGSPIIAFVHSKSRMYDGIDEKFCFDTYKEAEKFLAEILDKTIARKKSELQDLIKEKSKEIGDLEAMLWRLL